ncbi:aminotransferase class III-fold pyridoxal phosphate-dependent enzyme [Cochleicola gelatinilyticus]|nr:aminotransferase class III-fold pyridoxal phosphate-dependent enzyme [Cochleicola gelatinilyticus]
MVPLISTEKASELVFNHFGITSETTPLPGDMDINFHVKTESGSEAVLKISEATPDTGYLDFQIELLQHLKKKTRAIALPEAMATSDASYIKTLTLNGTTYQLRMLSWVPGRLWARVNPKTTSLRKSLGIAAGTITCALQDFKHTHAQRTLEWDLAEAAWTVPYADRFSEEEQHLILHFQRLFKSLQKKYETLPKSVVHNDINDYNILVSNNLKDPEVAGIIDFGDAVYTQTINDAAITICYAIMELPDPLAAAAEVVKGYHSEYPFSEKELELLYVLIGMRLVVSVTKSSLRKEEDPSNTYHVISEKPAWQALQKWAEVNNNFAHYTFRNACGYPAHPSEEAFKKWALSNTISLTTFFPTQHIDSVTVLDMSVGSTLLGNLSEYSDPEVSEFKLKQFSKTNPTTILANGYLETRPFYTTEAFKSEGNNGPQYRSTHLGTDFWVPAQTPIHAPFDGIVKIVHHNDYDKDYGPMLILEHTFTEGTFYSLYGHLTLETLEQLNVGDIVKQGQQIARIGEHFENGNWAPHLHFQLILDLLGNNENFNGVAFPSEIPVWKSICPDPNLIFKENLSPSKSSLSETAIIDFRKEHLGRSLSLSYSKPLHIVRGEGAYLIDIEGKKYLDTANNVNHVGHQHPRVVAAGQQQMAVLNTNTRYLHEEIINYADALLKKLPKELSVLHFVNSGSEANELALRMARSITGRKEIMAIEVGYHGNTNAAMDVSSYKFDGKGGSGKPEHTHILPLPDPYRGRHTDADSGSKYASYAKRHIEHLKIIDEKVAGFIGESMVSCGGQIVPPKNYFKKIYQYIREEGGICIADEVQTGFGRMGKTFWAFELYDVIPDIVTMGKPAGNGHPLAVVACTQEIAEAFDTGMEFFNTFGGNPVSCAIGRTVLEIIDDEGLQQHALDVGSFLKNELIALQEEFPIIGDVRGEGLFLGFELNTTEKKPLPQHAAYLADRMKELGILMSTDGPDYNVLKIKPPMVFSKDNAKELIFRLKTVFAEDFMTTY